MLGCERRLAKREPVSGPAHTIYTWFTLHVSVSSFCSDFLQCCSDLEDEILPKVAFGQWAWPLAIAQGDLSSKPHHALCIFVLSIITSAAPDISSDVQGPSKRSQTPPGILLEAVCMQVFLSHGSWAGVQPSSHASSCFIYGPRRASSR